MKKTSCLLILLLAALAGRGQNLVLNPGFEAYTSCPTAYSQIDRATGWVNASQSSPDYYNKCGTPNMSVPLNSSGYQVPHGGNAYAGIFLWSKGSTGREYIGGSLSSALLQGHTYHFEMFVNLANISRYTTSRIGAYFSDTLISGHPTFGLLPYTPQVENTGTTRFDSTGWTSVSGDFVARGNERYVVIGNFKPDALTDTLQVTAGMGTTDIVYCQIDDVSLVIRNNTGTGTAGAGAVRITAGPNPFSEKLQIHISASGTYELLLTDIAGRVIVQTHLSTDFEIATGQFPAGLYFYQIRGREGVVARDRILKL
ncbi:MAG TPA: T9SS type A sorting domain-containing protein [Flavitalea sp.]|nr:T9SS type A sorting domain-containing protein [Flavitalea sp.]